VSIIHLLSCVRVCQVTAKDESSYDLLVIDVLVLRNPCVNQGVCVGPETDPECTSANRTQGEDRSGGVPNHTMVTWVQRWPVRMASIH